MVSTVLLCPPDYYQIEYEINPWMHTENTVNAKRAREQFDALVDVYTRLGLNIEILDAQPGLPDMVYAANFGFVLDKTFIRSNFRYPQRRKEADFAETWFKKKGFTVASLPAGVFYEGRGEMCYSDGRFFCGYGKRMAKEAVPYLEEIIGESMLSLTLIDEYFYHFDMCFAPLGKGRVLINPRSFSREDNQKIKKAFRKVIETTEQDNRVMCCNMFVTGDTIVVGNGVSNDYRRTLEKEGFEVIEVAMDEFRRGGGSVKCLTLEFYSA